MLVSLGATTADTSRLTWIITLGLICAMFVVCLIIVVRGKHVGRHAAQTTTQKLRIMRARNGLWVLSALIFLTIARIMAAKH
jgi:hypothetical protein